MNAALQAEPTHHAAGAAASTSPERTLTLVASDPRTEYVFNRREHDHAWEGLYALDAAVPAEIQATLERICDDVRRQLLPKLGLFSDFQAAFVDPMLFGPYLGKYVEETHTQPCIALNYELMKEHQAISDLAIELWLETTVVHELAHACQDACGLQTHGKKAEEAAEELAYEWHASKQIPELLMKARLKPKRTGKRQAKLPAIPDLPLNITANSDTPDPRNELAHV